MARMQAIRCAIGVTALGMPTKQLFSSATQLPNFCYSTFFSLECAVIHWGMEMSDFLENLLLTFYHLTIVK